MSAKTYNGRAWNWALNQWYQITGWSGSRPIIYNPKIWKGPPLPFKEEDAVREAPLPKPMGVVRLHEVALQLLSKWEAALPRRLNLPTIELGSGRNIPAEVPMAQLPIVHWLPSYLTLICWRGCFSQRLTHPFQHSRTITGPTLFCTHRKNTNNQTSQMRWLRYRDPPGYNQGSQGQTVASSR